MKIAIVYDLENLDNERQKMVDSVKEVLSKYHTVEEVIFNEKFIEKIKQFDVVFNLSTAYTQLHVPVILDVLKIPYTGSSALSHAICIDKTVTKILLQHHGLPTPKFAIIDIGEEPREIDFYPAIVKPSREGSARGIEKNSVVRDLKSLTKAVERIHGEYKQVALVEEFIEGGELSVGVLAGEVLPILEIDFSTLPVGIERFYSYTVKHHYGDRIRYVCPANIDENLYHRIEQDAKKIFKILHLKNYARMDLRVKQDQHYFLEVNSLPMLTPGYSDIVKMAEVAGLSYEDLILKILEDALMNTKCTGTER